MIVTHAQAWDPHPFHVDALFGTVKAFQKTFYKNS